MAVPASALSEPYGVMTGFAKDVEVAVGKCELPGKTNRFLSEMKVRSFGNAGWQKESERPSLWCFFDLAKWCEALNVSKSTLIHIRQRLEADGILTYEPDAPAGSGTGKLFWNTNLAQWKPLQSEYVRWGGNRKKQSNIVHLNERRETTSREQSTPDIIASREQCKPATDAFKRTKAESSKGSAGQARQDALRRVTEEYKTKKKENHVAPIGAGLVAQESMFSEDITATPPIVASASDSQEQSGLQEQSTPMSAEEADFRRGLAEAQAQIADLQARLAADPTDAWLEYRIEQHQERVTYFEREIAALQPLDAGTWHKRLFSGLCALFNVDTQRLNPALRGELNRAAQNLHTSQIRPEWLPDLKAEYHRQWKWKQGTISDFAKNAVLFVDKVAAKGASDGQQYAY